MITSWDQICAGLSTRLRELCLGKCPPERPCTARQIRKYRAAAYRKHLGIEDLPAIVLDLPDHSACVYRGADIRDEVTGRAKTETCESCAEKKLDRLKVFACGLAERVALFGPEATVKDCADCPHFQASISPRVIRHLLYHVMPIRGNGVWQRNLDQLKVRLPLFNGQRVIAIATDYGDRLDPPQAVREYLRGEAIEFIEVANSRRLREMVSWHPLWTRLLELLGGATDGRQYVFYGHAKGVTKPVNPGVSVHRWASLMYEVNLDYLPIAEHMLRLHPVVGAFRKGSAIQDNPSPWHYSGTFFWVRLADALDKWQNVGRNWCGIEAWPGRHWTEDEAGCLFGEGGAEVNLYLMPYLAHVEKEYQAWKSATKAFRFLTG